MPEPVVIVVKTDLVGKVVVQQTEPGLTWAEQSDAVGREETVEEAATPLPPSSLGIHLAIFLGQDLG